MTPQALIQRAAKRSAELRSERQYRIRHGALKRARLDIHAAGMRDGFPDLAPHEWHKIEIARGLLQLQERSILRVWIEGGQPIVAQHSSPRPVGETYAIGSHKISWTEAALIVERGALS